MANLRDAIRRLNNRSISNVAEYVRWIAEVTAIFGEGELLWFRGLRDRNHLLIPKGLRRGFSEPPYGVNGELWRVLEQFRAQAVSRIDCPPVTTSAEWLTLAQHHGLPTTLLDWTRNCLAALWFATSREAPRDVNGVDPGTDAGAVWVINPRMLCPRSIFATSPVRLTDDVIHFAYGIDDRLWDYLGRSTFVTAHEMRHRLGAIAVSAESRVARAVAQHGEFTIHFDRDSFVDRWIDSGLMARCEIPHVRKSMIVNQLSSMGVDRATLFPDVASLAEHLATTNGW